MGQIDPLPQDSNLEEEVEEEQEEQQHNGQEKMVVSGCPILKRCYGFSQAIFPLQARLDMQLAASPRIKGQCGTSS